MPKQYILKYLVSELICSKGGIYIRIDGNYYQNMHCLCSCKVYFFKTYHLFVYEILGHKHPVIVNAAYKR